MKLYKLFGWWVALVAIIGIASTSFVVWVIIKVMQHFGII